MHAYPQGHRLMYSLEKLANTDSIADMKQAYLQQCVAPMHAIWEHGHIGPSDHYLLKTDQATIGYVCLNQQTLMQLHLQPSYLGHATEVLDFLLAEKAVEKALAATIEPHFLSVCLDRQKRIEINTLLYEDHQNLLPPLSGLGQLEFRIAQAPDFQNVLQHYARTADDGELSLDNLKAYLEDIMQHHRIFLLLAEGQLIGTSECRFSGTQVPYADLGMIVHPDIRRKGVGSHILGKAKEFCYQHNTKPICCCDADNIGSSKAIQKAGFISRHRVLELFF